MHDIILVGGVCVVYVGYYIYTTAKMKPSTIPKKGTTYADLVGLDRHQIQARIHTTLNQSATTATMCLRCDKTDVSPLDRTRYRNHVYCAMHRFLVHRMAVVWHLTDVADLRHTLVILLMDLMPTTACEAHHWIGDTRRGAAYWCRKLTHPAPPLCLLDTFTIERRGASLDSATPTT
jgi:hypothetical protein